MKPTGVFYHKSFSRKSYLTVGTRLKDFPDAFSVFKNKKNFKLIESPQVHEELILRVHTKELLEGVRRDVLCSTAWHSAGGVVKAGEMVLKGDLRNAFCYIGAGGHHAGRDHFWGYCCFNDVVLSIYNILEKFGKKKIAIIDTDAHHGDGTRELVADMDVLHFCICGNDYISDDGLKIDVSYYRNNYMSAVERFASNARKYCPELIFWYFGHDTHIGDYGDIGLTVRDYIQIAEVLKDLAAELCDEKLVVVLGGGSIPEVARESTLGIIDVLLR
jgi:acetoin utilization deacetylase AcuC-like enzyme